MKRIRTMLAAALATALPTPAFASDPSGLLTLVVGIPLLLCASALFALLLPVRSRRPVRVLACVVFVPVAAFSLYVALDAIRLLGHIGSEDSMIGLAFFGLLAATSFVFAALVRRSSPRD